MKKIEGGVCAANGFTANGVHCGIRKNKIKRDLSLIYSEVRATAASVYTTNLVKGAPIAVTKANIADGYAQAIICNSGNANTCNANGVEIATRMCELVAGKLNIDAKDIVVASTGVIGQPLDITPIKNGIPELVEGLEKSIDKSKHEVNEKNKAIAYEIKSTVEDMNEQIRNTSTLKMVLNKRKINLRVPVDDLLKPFEFDFDVEQLLAGQALELDAAEILKEVMPKLPEPFSKYIDTIEESPETIEVTSKKEE